MEVLDNKDGNEMNGSDFHNESGKRIEVYSNSVRAGKRTYFFDVKTTKSRDLFLTITESKKRFGKEGEFFFEKHKLFLYKEDFDKFEEGLLEALNFIRKEQDNIKDSLPISNEDSDDIKFEDLEK